MMIRTFYWHQKYEHYRHMSAYQVGNYYNCTLCRTDIIVRGLDRISILFCTLYAKPCYYSCIVFPYNIYFHFAFFECKIFFDFLFTLCILLCINLYFSTFSYKYHFFISIGFHLTIMSSCEPGIKVFMHIYIFSFSLL